MTEHAQRLAEDTFVALVLILGKMIEREKEKGGHHQVGGPPSSQWALELITKERTRILSEARSKTPVVPDDSPTAS